MQVKYLSRAEITSRYGLVMHIETSGF